MQKVYFQNVFYLDCITVVLHARQQRLCHKLSSISFRFSPENALTQKAAVVE